MHIHAHPQRTQRELNRFHQINKRKIDTRPNEAKEGRRCKVAISSSTKLCCADQARADAGSAHTHALINLLAHTHTREAHNDA